MTLKMTIITSLFVLPAFLNAKEKLFIPSNPQIKAPLLVALHGCLNTAEAMEEETGFSELAEKYGFYVLYPEPYMGEDESKGCFEFYSPESQKVGGGDAAAVVNRVQSIVAEYNLDEKRVFVAGMSAGSSLIPVLINCYPDVFQGAAMHSGMGYGLVSTWQESLWVAKIGPKKNKTRNNSCQSDDYKGKIFLIQGTKDKVMNKKHYALLHNDYLMGSIYTSEYVPETKNVFGYERRHYYRDGMAKGQTVYVDGLDHDWSGYKARNPFTCKVGPNVSTMIVDFFINQ